MGAFSDTVKNKMLDAVTGRTTYTAEAAYYIQLHTGSPGAAGTSNISTETTRKQATFGSAAASGAISNTSAVQWLSIAVSGTENITHVSAWSASGGGTHLGSDDVTSRTVQPGDTVTISIGELDLTITGTLP